MNQNNCREFTLRAAASVIVQPTLTPIEQKLWANWYKQKSGTNKLKRKTRMNDIESSNFYKYLFINSNIINLHRIEKLVVFRLTINEEIKSLMGIWSDINLYNKIVLV